ncbi:MAG: ABC transporter permease [Armatimonadota bacterium]|nr:ABC transporter permease [Armatimonadota bacterium]MDR7548633.1 ABC transporter permease [Armatimonadota bacterium]
MRVHAVWRSTGGVRQAVRLAGMIVVPLGTGLLVGSLLMWALGISPLAAFRTMLETVVGSRSGFTDMLLYATPLLLIALGYGLAYRARVWTVGGEGQFHAAAIAVAALVFTLPPTTPRLPGLLLMLAAGSAAGMLWALLPGWLRVSRQVNEVVSTLMLNFVGILAMHWVIRTVFRDPFAGILQTPPFPRVFDLPRLAGTRLHIGLIMALALVPVLLYVMHYSTYGFRIKAIGTNPWASRAVGIRVDRTIIMVFLISGMLAGLAGAVHVLGAAHRLIGDLSPGFGYTAIMVALLARCHPLGAVPSALLLAGLAVGSEGIQVEFGIPTDFVQVFAAVLVLCILAGDTLIWKGRSPS